MRTQHLIVTLGAFAAVQANGQSLQVTRSVVAGGGGTSQGPTLTLRGTSGQGAVGGSDSASGSLSGGFWGPVRVASDCPADVNGDGDASPADFTAWLGCFNNPGGQAFCGRADVNGDGSLTPADFTAWLGAFNLGCD